MGKVEKELLKCILALELEEGCASVETLNSRFLFSEEECLEILSNLEDLGLVKRLDSSSYILTEDGRKEIKIVFTGGVFDIIHLGHITALNEAKSYGDFLVVVVARDETVERMKGRKPLNDEISRLKIVKCLRMVDVALLGDEKNQYKIVEKVKPDVIALGYDQKHSEDEVKREVERLGLNVEVVRLKNVVPNVKTSSLLLKIVNQF